MTRLHTEKPRGGVDNIHCLSNVIMLQKIQNNPIVFILLLQSIYFIVIKAECLSQCNNSSDRNLLSNGRFKRYSGTNYPKVLHALIKTERGEYIYLKWVKADQYLANENLPVWIPTRKSPDSKVTYENDLLAMMDIGHFVMYHDVKHSSAIIYFENTDSISGVIDTKYYIEFLPLKLLRQCHEVGGDYVKRNSGQYHAVHKYPNVPPEIIQSFNNDDIPNHSSQNSPRFHGNEAGMSNAIPSELRNTYSSEKHYVEIIVYVAYDITRNYKHFFEENYLQMLVMDYLVYFNAIDMIFAKLKKHNINICINLAGFVIEHKIDKFSLLLKYPHLKHSELKNVLNIGDIYVNFEHHFYNDITPFTSDSFDLIFLMTSRSIKKKIGSSISGSTFHGEDMYESRKKNEPYNGIPITIMQYKCNYEDYYVAAHEIGHALGVSHDPTTKKCLKYGRQCYGIMQWKNSFCASCIDWSRESIEEIKSNMNHNRNYCFLLNYPRSLHSNKPFKSLSPCRQCHCYKYDSYGPLENMCPLRIPSDACASPLTCLKVIDGPIMKSTILPLDGTPCGVNKVCWNKECIEL